jgi:hypothetical protein
MFGETLAQTKVLILTTFNMANMKTGLSYFEEGGEVQQPAALTKPVAPKGKFAVASPIGSVPMGESVLENMQKLLEQKQAQQGSFLERLKDVKAVFTGSGATQAQAKDMRNKQREAQSADIFQIQNQLAQHKAAQAQLAKLIEEDARSGWGRPQAGGAPTAGTTPVTETAAPGAVPSPVASAPSVAPSPVDGAPPPEIAQQYQRIRGTEGDAAANKFRNDYLKEKYKASFNPNLNPLVEFTLPNGELKTMKLSQAQALADRDPTIAKYLMDAGVPVRPAAAPSAAAPSAAAPSAAAAPVEIRKPTTEIAAPRAAGPGIGGGSVTAAKANIEMQKDIETNRAKERTGNEEERLTGMLGEAKKAIDRADTASRINAIADADPEMYGVLAKPGTVSSIGVLLRDGIKVGTHGQIALPSIEDMVRRNQKGVTPEKLSRAREMDGYLRRVELDFSSAFKGQGAVSDNERKIVQAIAGSTSDPADLLRKKAAWLANSAQKDKDMKAAWEQFTAKYGDNVAYSRFERSSLAKQVTAAYEDRLRKQFENELKAYGNRPLVSAEEYDKGAIQKGGSKNFKPTEKQKSLVNRYTSTGNP